MSSAAVKEAEARCADLAKLEGKLASRCDATTRKLADAKADEQKYAAALRRTEDAYAEEPTDSNVRAIAKAREALDLAKLRVRKPHADYEAAVVEYSTWRADVAAAQKALSEAREAVRLAELKQRASVVEFRRRTSTTFASILGAIKTLQDGAAEIDRAFADANAAAREAGEPDLAAFHRVAPILRAAAAQHGASGLVNRGGFYKAARATEHGLCSALSISLLDAIQIHARNGGTIPNDQAAPLLERVLDCRTAGEGEALVAAAEASLKAEADAAARKRWDEVEGPAHAREQRQLGVIAGRLLD